MRTLWQLASQRREMPAVRIEKDYLFQSHSGSGWAGLPCYSSQGSDFNYDFHVTHDESIAPVLYNFRTAQELIDMGERYFARPGEQSCIPGRATAPVSPPRRKTLTPPIELRHHDKYP